MPRQASGPKLVPLKKKGWSQEVWYIRYRKNGNKTEVTTGSTDYGEANKYFQEEWLPEYYRKDKDRRDIDPSEFSVIDALLDYAEEHAKKTASPERIGYAIKALEPFWCDKSIDDIDAESCEDYEEYREVTDSTIRRELVVLRAAINHAKKRGRLTSAPQVFLPDEHEGKDRWLTRHEVARLMWYSRTIYSRLYLPLFIALALYTAARKSAILQLKWNQIDLRHNRIDFNPKGRKRTNKGRPIIPIGRRLRTFLIQAYKRRGNSEYVIHDNGKPIADIKKGFKNATIRAGLEEVTPHTMRHTAATWMAQRGISMFNIGGYLGQSVESTTAKYAHHHPDYMQGIEDAFDLCPRYVPAKDVNKRV